MNKTGGHRPPLQLLSVPAKEAGDLTAEAIYVLRDAESDEHSGALIRESPSDRNAKVDFTWRNP